ncbi:MAG TPA: DUF3617 family protein [Casimicrobiaceae bacterium]
MTLPRVPAFAPSPSTSRRLLALAMLFVAMPSGVRAEEIPAFRQGLWEYQRVAGGNRYAATECLDPGEESRRQQIALQKLGCNLSPITRAGSTWTYSADCMVKLPAGPAAFSTTSVLTADSDTAYQVEIRTTDRRGTSSQVISAHRVADCAN